MSPPNDTPAGSVIARVRVSRVGSLGGPGMAVGGFLRGKKVELEPRSEAKPKSGLDQERIKNEERDCSNDE
ncbi:hypothetical protein EVAR_44987_1 [Eumeta japonica]|uniref:Uncharacterized protein n=1 Tax=Eumeta variegata TaxID=151549 RepID=A0A4C1XDF0_EUMVA|nr:hypothetical protein EVAR_44987_1 [Eumeta japonica]